MGDERGQVTMKATGWAIVAPVKSQPASTTEVLVVSVKFPLIAPERAIAGMAGHVELDIPHCHFAPKVGLWV